MTTLASSLPPDVVTELRALEAELEAEAPPEVAAFTSNRATCACGDVTLDPDLEVAAVDEVDELFLHTPTLCFLLDDEAP